MTSKFCVVATFVFIRIHTVLLMLHRSADKTLARPTLPDVFCWMVRIFPLMLVLLYTYIFIYIYIYIYSTNIPPILIINRIYENQNHLSL